MSDECGGGSGAAPSADDGPTRQLDRRMVLPTYQLTADDLKQARELAAAGGRASCDLADIALVSVVSMVESNRPLIESSGQALLDAITVLLKNGMPVPDWMAEAFCDRMGQFQCFEASTLDDAFGIDRMTDRSREANRSRRKLRPRVCAALDKAMRDDPNRSIDDALFSEVAEALSISKSHCEDIYRETVRAAENGDLKDFRVALSLARSQEPSE